MRQTIHKKASKKAEAVDRLSMPESQSAEIAEIVRTIRELLKEIWDRDVSDVDQFSQDQKNNGTLKFRS